MRFIPVGRLVLLIPAIVLCAICSSGFAQGVYSVTVANGTGSGTLFSAIQQANVFGNGAVINIVNNLGTINVGQLPDISAGLTINGGIGNTLSGQNTNRIFFINAPSQTVQINNLTLANGAAKGGSGSSGGGGGGGGAGLGGAVFINSGNVNFNSDVFANNAAVGGAGGSSGGGGGGGGGGGLSFNGGVGTSGVQLTEGFFLLGPGGGGGAHTSAGAPGQIVTGGAGGGAHGAAGGSGNTSTPNGANAAGADGGGGAGGGEYGPYSATVINGGKGGNGSDFGGGGGGGSSLHNNAGIGGSGGFGAGGGGGADAHDGPGGDGGNAGFGGGGGGGGGSPNVNLYGSSAAGTGGFGGGNGGNGNDGAGGGGAAFGGAVFVRSGNSAQASFTDTAIDTGSLTVGSGGLSPFHNGGNGQTAGGAMFLMGGNATFTVSSANTTQTIAGSIAQSSASSITKAGPGTLVLSAANSYTGGTIVSGGTLRMPNVALPASTAAISSAAVLEYNDSTVLTQSTFTYSGAGTLRKTGSGTLIFGGQGNVNVNFSAGALIDVQAGLLTGTSSYQGIWAGNQASLNVAGGATFDAVEGGPTGTMQIDALTGSGSLSGGYFGAFNGLTIATLGVAGGSGVFSGAIGDDSGAHLAIVKSGSGTQTFTGSNIYSGGTTISGGALAIGATGGLPMGSPVFNNASLIVNANSTAGIISGSGTTTVGAGATLQASSFTQSGIAMQLGGTAPSANSKLNVTGALTESGTLNVSLVNNFKPLAGNSFDLFDSGSLSGAFSLLQLPTLNGRIVWDSSHLYDSGTLGGTLFVLNTYYAGDFNRDGHVNAADILPMEQALTNLSSYKATYAPGILDPQLALIDDVNGDGIFTNADLQKLLINLENGGGSADPVPEPSTFVLAVLAFGTMCLRFRFYVGQSMRRLVPVAMPSTR